MTPFICPACGGHHFGRDVLQVEPEVVLGDYRCHSPGCGWKGPRPPGNWQPAPPEVQARFGDALRRAREYVRRKNRA